VEVLFELPDLQSAELLEPSEVDPQELCKEQYTSRKGLIGPFGLQALASKDQTEKTTISFRIYRVADHYKCLMISDQTRLFCYTLQTYSAVHTFHFSNDLQSLFEVFNFSTPTLSILQL